MKIAIGSDHAGFELKEKVKDYLKGNGNQVKDFGAYSLESVDYPDIAKALAKSVAAKKQKAGILICGTGIGMCMTANKVRGIRAANAHNVYTAQMSREHNDANVLCLGARVLEEKEVMEMIDVFLATKFAGGRHLRRVNKIK